VDLHIHYPQTHVIGSPADGLLPWLENYTFPEEKRFSAPEYSAQAATFFIAELLRNGVTTALTFATSHHRIGERAFHPSAVAQLATDHWPVFDGPPCATRFAEPAVGLGVARTAQSKVSWIQRR
jgi:cytosine/adenosine deaminase-related metal-dependent hydrolase